MVELMREVVASEQEVISLIEAGNETPTSVQPERSFNYGI